MTPALSNFRRALTITERVIPTRSLQLIKDMLDGFQFGEGQRTDRGFHNLNLPVLLGSLFIDRTHHLQADHGSPVFTEDNIINSILILGLIDKQGSQPLTGNIDRSDDRLIFFYVGFGKSKSFQINIFFCRKDTEQTLVKHFIHKSADFVLDQLSDLFDPVTEPDTENLSLLTDNQNI